MATLKQKIEVELKMRELIESEDLPEPDRIEYGFTSIRLFWEEPKLCVVIDIDEPPEEFEVLGERLDNGEEVIGRIYDAHIDPTDGAGDR
jgi:hypothetical protein